MEIQPKKAIWLYADLEESAIGTRSRLADELCGIAVLTRTVERLLKVTEFDLVTIFCPADQQGRVKSFVPDSDRIIVHGLSDSVKSLAIKYRRWALESWRGGLGELCQFDENRVSREMIQFGIENKHHVIMVCPADAPLIDPELIDNVARHYEDNKDQMRFVFCQAPPGLCGCIYRLDMIHEIDLAGMTVGNLVAYDPNSPHSDQIVHECTYKVAKKIYYCFNRFIADNWRSWQLLEKLIESNEIDELVAEIITEQANALTLDKASVCPREIEIEITTSPSVRYSGYPHCPADRSFLARRADEMSLDEFRSIVNQFSGYDDLLLTIGGFGEPLAHNDIIEMVKYAKASGVYGINIETDGLKLGKDMTDKLIEAGVGVVTVWVDAWEDSTYKKVKAREDLSVELVNGNIRYFIEKAKGTDSIVVPAMTKTRSTLADMEPFYDQWRRAGALSIIFGYDYYCGYSEDKSVMNMCPPSRSRCNSLFRDMMILADGDLVLCRQDYAGQMRIGNVVTGTAIELWHSQQVEQVRNDHLAGDYDRCEMCGKCRQWFR